MVTIRILVFGLFDHSRWTNYFLSKRRESATALFCVQFSEEQTTRHSVVEISNLTGWYWA